MDPKTTHVSYALSRITKRLEKRLEEENKGETKFFLLAGRKENCDADEDFLPRIRGC